MSCGGYYCEDRSCERCKPAIKVLSESMWILEMPPSPPDTTTKQCKECPAKVVGIAQHMVDAHGWWKAGPWAETPPRTETALDKNVAAKPLESPEKCLAASPPPAAAPSDCGHYYCQMLRGCRRAATKGPR